eukprot:Tbor_TRINITY_DN5803_c2_g1::TRINITY_DN5803_c2_g1_i2::g.5858::m.5858
MNLHSSSLFSPSLTTHPPRQLMLMATAVLIFTSLSLRPFYFEVLDTAILHILPSYKSTLSESTKLLESIFPMSPFLGVEAAPKDETIEGDYTDEYLKLDSDVTHLGSLRLAVEISREGIMKNSKLLLYLSSPLGKGDKPFVRTYSTADIDKGRRLIQDLHGNLYKLRDHVKKTISIKFQKEKGLAKFSVGDVNSGEKTFTSMSEEKEDIKAALSSDFECTRGDERKYLCCPGTDGNSYTTYSIEKSPGSETTCINPPNAKMAQFLGYEFNYDLSFSFETVNATKSLLKHESENAGNDQLTSIISSKSFQTISKSPKETLTLCARPSLSDASSKAFLVPPSQFGNGFFLIGLTLKRYIETRGCGANQPLGHFTSIDGNNTDQMSKFVNVKSFGSDSKDSFGCDWANEYSKSSETTPPVISLFCSSEDLHYIRPEFKVSTTYFQPQYPFVSVVTRKALWDIRTKRLRISMKLWASGEWDANVSVYFNGCAVAVYREKVQLVSPTVPVRKIFIKKSYAERVHLIQRDVDLSYALPANVPANTIIGFCNAKVVIDGVKGADELFPGLNGINFTLVSIKTRPLVTQAKSSKNSNDKEWVNDIPPISSKPNPSLQTVRHREALFSRYPASKKYQESETKKDSTTKEIESPIEIIGRFASTYIQAIIPHQDLPDFMPLTSIWEWDFYAQVFSALNPFFRSDGELLPGYKRDLSDDGNNKSKIILNIAGGFFGTACVAFLIIVIFYLYQRHRRNRLNKLKKHSYRGKRIEKEIERRKNLKNKSDDSDNIHLSTNVNPSVKPHPFFPTIGEEGDNNNNNEDYEEIVSNVPYGPFSFLFMRTQREELEWEMEHSPPELQEGEVDLGDGAIVVDESFNSAKNTQLLKLNEKSPDSCSPSNRNRRDVSPSAEAHDYAKHHTDPRNEPFMDCLDVGKRSQSSQMRHISSKNG